MSVLIRGMEMPENGTYICIIENNNIWFLNNDNAMKFRTGEICEVPTPHGDLIDKDEILYYFEPYKDGSGSLLKITAPTVIESEE